MKTYLCAAGPRILSVCGQSRWCQVKIPTVLMTHTITMKRGSPMSSGKITHILYHFFGLLAFPQFDKLLCEVFVLIFWAFLDFMIDLHIILVYLHGLVVFCKYFDCDISGKKHTFYTTSWLLAFPRFDRFFSEIGMKLIYIFGIKFFFSHYKLCFLHLLTCLNKKCI